ncbi:MAG: 1-acyl-sn-glycerol-3-phosphate acyltransferase [Flavobacteriales bacterium]|nr:1-acyl-sn-glycerol-3-phosphate acyltransferase [Flavobacteriales bacterium]
MEDRFIDIERAIKSKNPRLLRWMPGFLLRYLKKKIRQDESNAIIAANEGSNGYEFSKYVIDYLNIKVVTEGMENIPKDGGAIIAVNHPLGGIDALAIIQEVYPNRPDLKFVVNDLLMQLDNLKDLFVGVNKHGANSKESLQKLNEVYESDQLVFVFPAGLVSRKKKGKVEDLEWKKTFITRAKKLEKPVIPVYLDGELSRFFYRLSNFRSKIGIKANLEMFYLVDELFKQAGKTLTIRFGTPISPDQFDNSKKDIEWAQWVKEKVYKLKEKP